MYRDATNGSQVKQCCFFQSKAIANKFADQADNIAHFTNLFFFLKEKFNYNDKLQIWSVARF